METELFCLFKQLETKEISAKHILNFLFHITEDIINGDSNAVIDFRKKYQGKTPLEYIACLDETPLVEKVTENIKSLNLRLNKLDHPNIKLLGEGADGYVFSPAFIDEHEDLFISKVGPNEKSLKTEYEIYQRLPLGPYVNKEDVHFLKLSKQDLKTAKSLSSEELCNSQLVMPLIKGKTLERYLKRFAHVQSEYSFDTFKFYCSFENLDAKPISAPKWTSYVRDFMVFYNELMEAKMKGNFSHGDIGSRNIIYSEGRMILIDFARTSFDGTEWDGETLKTLFLEIAITGALNPKILKLLVSSGVIDANPLDVFERNFQIDNGEFIDFERCIEVFNAFLE